MLTHNLLVMVFPFSWATDMQQAGWTSISRLLLSYSY